MKSTDMREQVMPLREEVVPTEEVQEIQLAQEAQMQLDRQLRESLLRFLIVRDGAVHAFAVEIGRGGLLYVRDKTGNLSVHQETDVIEELLRRILDENGKRAEVQRVFERATKSPMSGAIEFCARLEGDAYRWYRTHFCSSEVESGAIWLVGVTARMDGEALEKAQMQGTARRDPRTRFYLPESMETLVNRQAQLLSPGEKGVFFAVSLDDYERAREIMGITAYDNYFAALADAARKDFRGVDLLGRLNEQEVAIFISGQISIDVIERRAQHIMDIFLRIQPQDLAKYPVSFSMGIAVTGREENAFPRLRKEAEAALISARRFGPNRYRMYADIKE